MNDQPYAETSTWHYPTLTRDRHPRPWWDLTCNPSKWAAADPCIRPHGHWDWLSLLHTRWKPRLQHTVPL